MKLVTRSFIPAMSDITAGPPVARVIPFSAAVMSAGVVAAFVFGLPTASTATLPLFVLPIFLLASRNRSTVATGFGLLAIGCAARALAAFFVDNLLAGQVVSALFGWGWMSFNFLLSTRMVLARGVRQR